MRNRSTRLLTWMAVIVVSSMAVGCAKQVQAPPTPPPAPPREPAPAEPTPRETPVPPEPRGVTSGDFQPVFYDYDSYTLRGDGRTALDGNARLLREDSDLRVTIEGHCDDRGTIEYNLALGERRAQAAKDYLVNAGISASRLSTISYGEERPFASGSDEEAWSKNRRAHFVVP